MAYYVDMLDETNNCRFACTEMPEKLHIGAQILGFPPSSFVEGENLDYYLLKAEQRAKAISKGAYPVTNAYLSEKCGKHNQRFKAVDEEIFEAFE